MDKLLKKYSSEKKLNDLKSRLKVRFKKYGIVGNKISIAYKNIVENINDILSNKDLFLKCDICGDKVSSINISENFEDDFNVCKDCIETKYDYCVNCGKPIFCDDIDYILEEEIYCNICYFKEKDNIIAERKIKNLKLQKLQDDLKDKNLPVNYKNLKDYHFVIKGWNFNIERYAGFRLGSWSANFWIDLTSKEKNLLKAVDYMLENGNEELEYIFKG